MPDITAHLAAHQARVDGLFIAGSRDGTDPDNDVDLTPLQGLTITLTPSVRVVELPHLAPPATLVLRTWALTTDALGRLTNPETGEVGVAIPSSDVASDDPDRPVVWTSTIAAPDTGVPSITKHWVAPAGETVDLTSVESIPGVTPINLTQWQRLVADARGAKDLAVAASTIAVDARDKAAASEAAAAGSAAAAAASASSASDSRAAAAAIRDDVQEISGLTGEDEAVALLVEDETTATGQAVAALASTAPRDGFSNAPRPLTLRNYLGNVQNIHPKVLHFPTPRWGYRWWMAYTPYPYGDTKHENPCLAVSNDGVTWTAPPSVTNPLEPWDGNDRHYNSDTHLVWRSDTSTLEIWWRAVESENSKWFIRRRTTTDGTTWTPTQTVAQGPMTADRLSPAVIHEAGEYRMWSIRFGVIHYETSADGLTWSGQTPVNINWGTLTPWHLDVIPAPSGGGYEMVVTAYPPGGNNNSADLYHVRGATPISGYNRPVRIMQRPLTPSWDDAGIYRASLVHDGDHYWLYYSAIGSNSVRGIAVAVGSSIGSLRGMDSLRHELIAGGTTLTNYDLTGVSALFIDKRVDGVGVTFDSFAGGHIGQVVPVVCLSSASEATFNPSAKITTPGGVPYVLTPESVGAFLVASTKRDEWRLVTGTKGVDPNRVSVVGSSGEDFSLTIRAIDVRVISRRSGTRLSISAVTGPAHVVDYAFEGAGTASGNSVSLPTAPEVVLTTTATVNSATVPRLTIRAKGQMWQVQVLASNDGANITIAAERLA